MDYDSYQDSESEIAESEVSGDSGDYGFDGGSDEQPRARQVQLQSSLGFGPSKQIQETPLLLFRLSTQY